MDFWFVILGVVWAAVFLLPGFLLQFLIFKKTRWLERGVYTIAFSSFFSTVVGLLLGLWGELRVGWVLGLWGVVCAGIFAGVWVQRKNIHSIRFVGTWWVVGAAIVGSVWRLWLIGRGENFGDAYGYSSHFIETSIRNTGSLSIIVPDLHFYTGMVSSHARFIGGEISNIIWQLGGGLEILEVFLGVFMYLGFLYIVIEAFSKRKDLALAGVALFMLGPLEIWHSTLSFFGHPLSYVALFSLFLLFVKRELEQFYASAVICMSAITAYYTAALVIIIACVGFLLACALKEERDDEEMFLVSFFKKETTWYFIILALLSGMFLFFVGGGEYTAQNAYAVTHPTLLNSTLPQPSTHSPFFKEFLGLSLMRWEGLFFLMCGLGFLFFISTRPLGETSSHSIFALIPVTLIGAAFFFVNLPARALDYLAFFSVLTLRMRGRMLVCFTIIAVILLGISIGIRNYNAPLLSYSSGEKEGAHYVRVSLEGVVFSDQVFNGLLIRERYYDVEGIDDIDWRNALIFHTENESLNRAALESLNASYIALTRRMREDYILHLNFPQAPISNEEFYERTYRKVYDNGDVRIYEV